jgi:hypothetical protein
LWGFSETPAAGRPEKNLGDFAHIYIYMSSKSSISKPPKLTERELLRRGPEFYECPCKDLILGKKYLIEVLNSKSNKLLVGTFDGVYFGERHAKSHVESTIPVFFEKAPRAHEGIFNGSYNGGLEEKFGDLVIEERDEAHYLGYEPEYYYGIFANVREIDIKKTREKNEKNIFYNKKYIVKGDEKTKIMFTVGCKINKENENEFNVEGFKFYKYDYLPVLFLTSETTIKHVLDNKLPIGDEYFAKDLAKRIQKYLEHSLGGGEKKKRNLKSRKTKNRNRRTVKLL